MIAHARHLFGLSRRANRDDPNDGTTVRDHLMVLAKHRAPGVSANAVRLLTSPPLPPSQERIWHWFLELQSRRGEGMSGATRLTWPELQAWASLMERRPTPNDLRVIGRLDDAYLESVRGKE